MSTHGKLNSYKAGGFLQRSCLALALLAFACEPVLRETETIEEAGVSLDLAQLRKGLISNLRYSIEFEFPDSSDEIIPGRVSIEFDLKEPGGNLPIDFRQPEKNVLQVAVANRSVPISVRNGHILIPEEVLAAGPQKLSIRFLAGPEPFNRRPDYLYSLFVPDRASLAFPCFDQPDLKARFRLTVVVPEGWTAVSNSPVARTDGSGGRKRIEFQETRPMSTYLFSVAAGRFLLHTSTRDRRSLSMLYRETDKDKVARNVDAVFDLHARALSWLETYTEIPYPFEKFDFVLIPDFQFGGMEHPGAILYRESSLLLDKSATQAQELNRARLIAHETAHMWFGNLVTMKWFDDVWMKEVFANLLAAKMVNPSFPEIDHDLQFLLSHYPGAYAIDRSQGTHPIRQSLENLNDAASLYGAIIYQKAPIAMQQLEVIVGSDTFRDGIREYLAGFQFNNAGWPDLVALLDRKTDEDLVAWSERWIEEGGRPTVFVDMSTGGTTARDYFQIRQVGPQVQGQDSQGGDRVWVQPLELRIGWPQAISTQDLMLQGPAARIHRVRPPEVPPRSTPLWILPGRSGYGFFRLDKVTREYLLEHLFDLPDGFTRARAWMSLWEEMLDRAVPPSSILRLALRAIPKEDEEQVTDLILQYLIQLFWRYLPAEVRPEIAPQVEEVLWGRLQEAPNKSLKASLFQAYVSVALSSYAVERLETIWAGTAEIPGLPLAEADFVRLSQELAVRGIPNGPDILRAQLERIENLERREAFQFVLPAVSPVPELQDRFFAKLSNPKERRHERWVLDGLRYLHHPLRAGSSLKYIRPGLDMLQEIKRTGDIFFPKGWLDAILEGHQSRKAAEIVHSYLQETPLPPRLRGKVLQSADGLLRAAQITHEWSGY